ncbi:hypothetical protein HDU76_002539 [Blyttiomyces sp. JEL0837]|nr:hypothetical protein HDU76_002539 [Blyttiomyces sp. JEL0837]
MTKVAAVITLGPCEQAYIAPPGWTFTRVFQPIRTTSRLIIPFIKTNWTSHSKGIVGDDRKLPKELEARGITQAQWDQILESLWPVQKKSHTVLTSLANYVTLVGIPIELHHQNKYHEAVKGWLDYVNETIFKPAGVVAKLPTCESDVYVSVSNGGHSESRNDHQECSWLAISLDDVEKERLIYEPVFWFAYGGKLIPAGNQHHGRVV